MTTEEYSRLYKLDGNEARLPQGAKDMLILSVVLAFLQVSTNPGVDRYVSCGAQNVTGRDSGEIYVSNIFIVKEFGYNFFDAVAKADEFAGYIRKHHVHEHDLFEGCSKYDSEQQATARRADRLDPTRFSGTYRFIAVDWPSEARPPAGAKTVAEKGRTPGKVAKRADLASALAAPTAQATASKYVEVAGPDGKTIRLSPEVAARNQAAADDYRRKMDEHASAKAEHDRKLAAHQQSIAAAAAEKRAYELKLAMNDAQVAAHGAALEQHKAAARQPAKGAKGWMYCDARGTPGDKRRYYSRVTEIDYMPGEITIIDVMAKNRPAFKSYVASTHSIYFATDSLLHCPYSTTSLADAEALMARDKRGDGNNGIEVIQTGWVPASSL